MTPKPMSADTMVERLTMLANAEGGGPVADALDEAADLIERLEAEKRLWLPIESAPKDATWVLTWSAKDGPGLGRYMGYTSLTDDENWSGATHWMPFPELPKASAVGEIRDHS